MLENNTDFADLDESFPFRDGIGFRLIEWEEGRARFGLDVEHRHSNRVGIPHGGVYATMLDTSMAYAGCYSGLPGDVRLAVTMSMTVNFLSAPKGKQLWVEGKVIRAGGRSYNAEARLTDELGTLVATASGVFQRRPKS